LFILSCRFLFILLIFEFNLLYLRQLRIISSGFWTFFKAKSYWFLLFILVFE
jgi:hypothetical protein